MEGKNNLRAQIEQLFRDNPRKSFGVSEIAGQLNARRNTIHYHLKTLKTTGFLGQDTDGAYYLALNEGEDGKSKIGMMRCRYHSQVLNVDWCPFCGNPICERCVTDLPMGFASCPECKQKKINSSNRVNYFVNFTVLLLTVLFITLELDVFVKIILVALFIYMIVLNLSWIKAYSKDRKEYFTWKRSLDARPISDEETKSLIHDKKMNPCKYHENALGVTTCERCGRDICKNCSTILHEFTTYQLVCIGCFWNARKRADTVFGSLFGIIGSFGAPEFIFMLVVVEGRLPLTAWIFPMLGPVLGIAAFIVILLDYFKNKRKYDLLRQGFASTVRSMPLRTR